MTRVETGKQAASGEGQPAEGLDVASLRADFPILGRTVHDRPLVYLDNAATTQCPQAVIDRIERFYRHEKANIHRAAHRLAEEATQAYEDARRRVAAFLGAGRAEQIIFTRGATEAINLVAQSWGRANLGAGDEILLTHMEHHSNLVPWQLLAEQTGARVKVLPVNAAGELEPGALDELLSARTKLVGLTYVSNAIGTVNPVEQIVERAHEAGARVLVDAAQAAPHLPLDVARLDCDFLAFSGHKVYGPTGIGALYGKAELLEAMPPWQGGGEMIETVTLQRSTYAEPPHRFEAGTPDIAGAIGLAAALDYVDGVGLERMAAWEDELLRYATGRLEATPGVRLIGTASRKAAVASMVLDFAHPLDAATILDRLGIAVRSGQHCAHPLLSRLGVEGTLRASFAFYNTKAEVDTLIEGLEKVRQMM